MKNFSNIFSIKNITFFLCITIITLLHSNYFVAVEQKYELLDGAINQNLQNHPSPYNKPVIFCNGVSDSTYDEAKDNENNTKKLKAPLLDSANNKNFTSDSKAGIAQSNQQYDVLNNKLLDKEQCPYSVALIDSSYQKIDKEQCPYSVALIDSSYQKKNEKDSSNIETNSINKQINIQDNRNVPQTAIANDETEFYKQIEKLEEMLKYKSTLKKRYTIKGISEKKKKYFRYKNRLKRSDIELGRLTKQVIHSGPHWNKLLQF